MSGKQKSLSDDELQNLIDQIEKTIVKRYTQRFIGVVTGMSVVITIIGYLGFSNLQDSISEKVVNKLLNQQFKEEITEAVTDTLISRSSFILQSMQMNKSKTDSLLHELTDEHSSVLRAANNEFRRTIEVLGRVRDNYSSKR